MVQNKLDAFVFPFRFQKRVLSKQDESKEIQNELKTNPKQTKKKPTENSRGIPALTDPGDRLTRSRQEKRLVPTDQSFSVL